MFPTFSSHKASTTTLNMSDITAATVGEKTPAATPTARARKMYTASFVSLRVLRNRTAATMAASVNARARLFWIRITVAATVMGRMMTVCTTDWSYPERCLVSMYTQETGSTSSSAVSIDRRGTSAHMPSESVLCASGGASDSLQPLA